MTNKLRELINAGLKTYDEDIKDDIIDEIDNIDKQISELREEHSTYEEFINNQMLAKNEIDFGIAKLYYREHKGGSALLTELMNAIKDKAMVTPLYDMVNAIKKL